MALPNRDNPYSFEAYLSWRKGVDYWRDDPFLQRALAHYSGDEQAAAATEALSPKVSGRWRQAAEAIARLEKRPFLLHFDGHNQRVDQVVRPAELVAMEREVFGEGLFSSKTSRWARQAKLFLIHQNGESCTTCPLACTEGMVELLDLFADTPQTRQILQHVKEGRDGEYAIGAQFLTEIQGGSDVPSNLVEAVDSGDGNTFRIHGKKYFCSVAHADYALVTAKPTGSESIGIFAVPAYLTDADREAGRRNGARIDKLKWKLGTTELPTAEITFDGAVGYRVGPLDRGLANVVGIVLTVSRLNVGISAAAMMTQAAREATRYAELREAFGQPIARFPMLAGQLQSLQRSAQRTLAGAFKVYGAMLDPRGGLRLRGGLRDDAPIEAQQERFAVRELIMLQKITAAWDATDVLRLALSVFGGHGVMEDFCSLPRLFRDAAINELWEGPRNTLLTQIFRDCKRAAEWYAPAEFVGDLLQGGDEATVTELAAEMTELVGYPSLLTLDEETIAVCRQWDDFCHRLMHAYQDLALAAVR